MYNFLRSNRTKSKSIYRVLRTIPNVGNSTALAITKALGLLRQSPISCLTDFQLKDIVFFLEELFKGKSNIGFLFLKHSKQHLTFLSILGSNKSVRLFGGLPVRGQRTKTNAHTSRRLKPKQPHR